MKVTKLKTLGLLVGLCLGLSLPSFSTAFADDHGKAEHRHSDHYYRNGSWYHHGWFGMEVREPSLARGVYVETLPSAYTPMVIQGTTYYYGDNTYFTASSNGGYTVVAAPNR